MVECSADAKPDAAMLCDVIEFQVATYRQLDLPDHLSLHLWSRDFENLMAAARVEPSRLRRQRVIDDARVSKLGVLALRVNAVFQPVVGAAS